MAAQWIEARKQALQRPGDVFRHGRRRTGFTLIEVLVALVVASILLAIAVPSLRSFQLESEMSSVGNHLVVDLTFARNEAMARRVQVTACRSQNPLAATPLCDTNAMRGWESGWVIFEDSLGNGVFDAGDKVLRTAGPETTVTIRGEASVSSQVSFSRTGLITGGQIVVCNEKGFSDGGRDARVILLSVGGRILPVTGDQNPAPTPVTTCTPA